MNSRRGSKAEARTLCEAEHRASDSTRIRRGLSNRSHLRDRAARAGGEFECARICSPHDVARGCSSPNVLKGTRPIGAYPTPDLARSRSRRLGHVGKLEHFRRFTKGLDQRCTHWRFSPLTQRLPKSTKSRPASGPPACCKRPPVARPPRQTGTKPKPSITLLTNSVGSG